MNEQLVLVSPDDHPIGVEEKMTVHRRGLLHRAFSIVLYNHDDELLLQRRAHHKYHSGGLWSNACCGHPRPGEDIATAAARRLSEELDIACELIPAGVFRYKVSFPDGLTENEIDHVFLGRYEGGVTPNPAEVDEYRWASADSIEASLRDTPEAFTHWFALAFDLFNLGQPTKLWKEIHRKNGEGSK